MSLCGSVDECEESDNIAQQRTRVRQNSPVLPVTSGPRQSEDDELLWRMQSLGVGPHVRFSDRTEVLVLDDWPPDVYREARREPWVHQFKRETETIFAA